MFVAFCSFEGWSMSWALRLIDEGHTVLMYIKDPMSKKVADGLVPKAATWDELLLKAKQADLAGHPVVVFFDFTSMGEWADKARAWGLPVVGGCEFMDKLESDRVFGCDFAEESGILNPPYQEFDSLDDVIAWAPSLGDTEAYLKPDSSLVDKDATSKVKGGENLARRARQLKKRINTAGHWVVQQKIEGVAFSTARWWNGLSWTGPYEGTIEHKALLNDDLGPATGAAFNTVWFYGEDQPRIAEKLRWESLATGFRRHNAAGGLYDINAIVTPQGEAYFLEWTPRLGYFSEMSSFRLLPDLGAHIWAIATGGQMPDPSSNLAFGVHLYTTPWPLVNVEIGHKESAIGKQFPATELWSDKFVATALKLDAEEGLVCAITCGSMGVAVAEGNDLEKMAEECQEYGMSLKDDVAGIGFRTDGYKCLSADGKKVLAAGLEIHEGIE